MKAATFTKTGSKASSQVTLPEVFDTEVNDDLLAQYVYVYLSNQRQANAHTKMRGEVRGGGKKPGRQKGTGRARHGSRRSPIWTGGGITFGPRKIRNFKKNISKKMRKAAFASALAAKAANDSVVVFDSFDVSGDKKTASLEQSLLKAGLEGKILIVQAQAEQDLVWAARNLFDVEVTHTGELNTYMILNADVVVLTKDAVAAINDRFVAKTEVAAEAKTTAKKTTAKKSTKTKTTSKTKKS